MQLSPLLAELEQYPFTRLDDWRAEARTRGIEVIDFGVGDPREPTPQLVREALVAAIPEVSSYPRAVGLPAYRDAVAAWIGRRFGVEVDPAVEIVPTLGSKEAIFSFAQVALSGGKRLVAVPSLAYPVYERGARFAGAEVVTVPLSEDTAGCPTWTRSPRGTRSRCSGRATRTTPPGQRRRSRSTRSSPPAPREHGFLVCSDEAYSELWFGESPASALQVGDRSNVVVFNTLSKRSSMTGIRCGFVCAPREVADALRAFRPSAGTAPQEFVQWAGVAALSDERHVEEVREVYRRKRETLLPVLERKGLRLAGGDATFFLWLAVDGASEPFARRLLDAGILVAPGSFFGADGEGYVRMALVPTQADCERAAEILEAVL